MKYYSEQLEADYNTHFLVAGAAQPGYTFAVKWAEAMEQEMEITGKTVDQVAEPVFNKVIVTEQVPLTDSLVSVAVKVLTLCWLHKDAFFGWFESEMQKEAALDPLPPPNSPEEFVAMLQKLLGPNVTVLSPMDFYGDDEGPPDSQPS